MSRSPSHRQVTPFPSSDPVSARSLAPASPALEEACLTAAIESPTSEGPFFPPAAISSKSPTFSRLPTSYNDQEKLEHSSHGRHVMTSHDITGSGAKLSNSSTASEVPLDIGTDSRPFSNPGGCREVSFGATTNPNDEPTARDNRAVAQSSGLDAQQGEDDSKAVTPSNLRSSTSTSNLISGESERSYTGPRASSPEELLKTKMPPLFSPAAGQGVFTPLSHARLEKNEDTEKDEHAERTERVVAIPQSPGFSPSSTPRKFTWSHTLPCGEGESELQQSPEKGAKKTWGKSATVPRYQNQRFSPYPTPSKSKYKLGAHASSIPLAVFPPVKGLGDLDGSSAGVMYSGTGLSAAVDINLRGRPTAKSRGKSTAVSDPKRFIKKQMKEVAVISVSVYTFKKHANLSLSPSGPPGFAVNLRISWSTMFIDPSKYTRRQISPSSGLQRAIKSALAMDDSASLLQINITLPAFFFRVAMNVTAAIQLFLSSAIGTNFITLAKAMMSLTVGIILWVLSKLGLENLVQMEYH